jgi:hypothetical protein
MRQRKTVLLFAVLGAALAVSGIGHAVNPNIRGRVIGQEKLLPEVYAEAAKPDSHRWTWREPSPAVDPRVRTLSANVPRDVCIAATSAQTAGPQEPVLMKISGGRIVPTTLVISPKTKIVLKNVDPFPHKAYIVGNKAFNAEVIQPNATREWTAPDGNGRYELRDELYPSVRTWVVVDPQVLQITYPGRDGAFALTLPAGDYVLKPYFQGKRVGKSTSVVAKDRGTFEIKDPLNLAEGGD